MKASEVRVKTAEQIQMDIQDVQEELMNLRFRKQSGQLTDSSLLRKLRRDIARLKTILRERELSSVRARLSSVRLTPRQAREGRSPKSAEASAEPLEQS